MLAYEGVAGARLPSTIDPDKRPTRERPARRCWVVRQCGDALVLDPAAADDAWVGGGPGSPVATFTAAKREIWVQRGDDLLPRRTLLDPGTAIALTPGERIRLRSDCGEVTLAVWERGPWAVAAGRDRYGLWAAFEVSGVQQRMRWIPPGRFLMGSSDLEAELWGDEDPQHWVTITQGYWLGETPVTQELWRAVMAKNPSRFVSDDRPVEQVSWEDCQKFIGRLNRRLDGLEIRLPTEVEWERACRAGTPSATWVGDLTLRGERDAPELDAIAWYGGNSGVDFELDDGHDVSDWPEKQYSNTKKAGTHPVGHKAPNPYGLHDMLGNVLEWCQSAFEDYPFERVVDPVSPGQGRYTFFRDGSWWPGRGPHGFLRGGPWWPGQGPYGFLRGGSWYDHARRVRAAYRYEYSHVNRLDVLGFRLAGGQESVPSQPGRAGKDRRSGNPGPGAGHDTSSASGRDTTTPRRNVKMPARPKRTQRKRSKKKDA